MFKWGFRACDWAVPDFHCVSMLLCRQMLFLHRQALIEQLKESEDPALVLHLTSVLLFQATTQCMVHAPGRCVPQIISILTGRIPVVSLNFRICRTINNLSTIYVIQNVQVVAIKCVFNIHFNPALALASISNRNSQKKQPFSNLNRCLTALFFIKSIFFSGLNLMEFTLWPQCSSKVFPKCKK